MNHNGEMEKTGQSQATVAFLWISEGSHAPTLVVCDQIDQDIQSQQFTDTLTYTFSQEKKIQTPNDLSHLCAYINDQFFPVAIALRYGATPRQSQSST